MQYLRKTIPEPLVVTDIFSQFDDKIDDALLTTGIADDRVTLRILRSFPLEKGGLGMPLTNGHHGKRHHLITTMRTKELLKLFYPSLVQDHTVLFNSQDIDLDGTPPDDLSDFILRLRERAPALKKIRCRFLSRHVVSSPTESTPAPHLLSISNSWRWTDWKMPRSFSVFKALSSRLLSILKDPA